MFFRIFRRLFLDYERCCTCRPLLFSVNGCHYFGYDDIWADIHGDKRVEAFNVSNYTSHGYCKTSGQSLTLMKPPLGPFIWTLLLLGAQSVPRDLLRIPGTG